MRVLYILSLIISVNAFAVDISSPGAGAIANTMCAQLYPNAADQQKKGLCLGGFMDSPGVVNACMSAPLGVATPTPGAACTGAVNQYVTAQMTQDPSYDPTNVSGTFPEVFLPAGSRKPPQPDFWSWIWYLVQMNVWNPDAMANTKLGRFYMTAVWRVHEGFNSCDGKVLYEGYIYQRSKLDTLITRATNIPQWIVDFAVSLIPGYQYYKIFQVVFNDDDKNKAKSIIMSRMSGRTHGICSMEDYNYFRKITADNFERGNAIGNYGETGFVVNGVNSKDPVTSLLQGGVPLADEKGTLFLTANTHQTICVGPNARPAKRRFDRAWNSTVACPAFKTPMCEDNLVAIPGKPFRCFSPATPGSGPSINSQAQNLLGDNTGDGNQHKDDTGGTQKEGTRSGAVAAQGLISGSSAVSGRDANANAAAGSKGRTSRASGGGSGSSGAGGASGSGGAGMSANGGELAEDGQGTGAAGGSALDMNGLGNYGAGGGSNSAATAGGSGGGSGSGLFGGGSFSWGGLGAGANNQDADASGVDQAGFGKKPASGDLKIEDPSDYWGRVDPKKTLFRRVTDQHRTWDKRVLIGILN